MASIKELKRMCKSNKGHCTNCPLYESNRLCVPHLFPDNADEIVNKWVQEHPVKTYADDFFEKFPNAGRRIDGAPKVCWEHVYGNGSLCFEPNCMNCWNQEIDEGR